MTMMGQLLLTKFIPIDAMVNFVAHLSLMIMV